MDTWPYISNYVLSAPRKELKDGTNVEERSELMKEATVTAQFQNPNVVMIIGVVTVGNPLMLVIQLCENGSLNHFLKDEPRSPQLKVAFSLDISRGMKYLISLGFIHRDLAARNVLVDAKLAAKIADFGLSRDTEDAEYYVAKAGKVPIRWTAPEALTSRKFSEASDVWAFGITIIEVWQNGDTPYKGWMNSFVLEQVVHSDKPSQIALSSEHHAGIGRSYSPQARAMLRSLLRGRDQAMLRI